MIKMQISLSAEQHAGVRRLAGDRGVSMSEVIRRAIDAMVGADCRQQRVCRALEAIKGIRAVAESTDVARRHDDYLDDSFGQ